MPRALKLRYDKIEFSTTLVCQDALTSEVAVLNALAHPNIVRTHGEIRGPLPMRLVSLLPTENQGITHVYTLCDTRSTYKQSRRHAYTLANTCRVGSRERLDGRAQRRMRPFFWCWISINDHYSMASMSCGTTCQH